MIVNCTNVDELVIGRLRSQNDQKQTYAGTFRGIKVAVKVLYQKGRDMHCQKHGGYYKSCYYYPYLRMLYTIFLNKQLRHPGISNLLGYCVRDVHHPPLPEDAILKQGVIAVFESGDKFIMNNESSLSERLQFAYQLADVLDYLANSPIGSVHVGDFMPNNLETINGQLKIPDLENSYVLEPKCVVANETVECPHRVECVDGTCVGHNAKRMMEKAEQRFFSKWLMSTDSTDLKYENDLAMLSLLLKEPSTTAAKLKRAVKTVLKKIH